MKKKIYKVVLSLFLTITAIVVLYLGAISRPLPAFGGEDMLAIIILGYAVYVLFRKEEKK